jgi:hypothetical protein
MLSYRTPRPLHVKWNRLVNSLIMIVAVFSERVEFLYAFLFVNMITLLISINYGPIRWALFPFENAVKRLLDVSPAYARSYAMNAATERFEILSRIVAVSIALTLYGCCPMATWLISVAMGIFMLISTFFGFCLSALGFIALRYAKESLRVR